MKTIKTYLEINSSNLGFNLEINGNTCHNRYDVSSMVGFKNSLKWFKDRYSMIL